jgi:hypothetical protein
MEAVFSNKDILSVILPHLPLALLPQLRLLSKSFEAAVQLVWEGLKEDIRESYSHLPAWLLSIEAGRLVSYVLLNQHLNVVMEEGEVILSWSEANAQLNLNFSYTGEKEVSFTGVGGLTRNKFNRDEALQIVATCGNVSIKYLGSGGHGGMQGFVKLSQTGKRKHIKSLALEKGWIESIGEEVVFLYCTFTCQRQMVRQALTYRLVVAVKLEDNRIRVAASPNYGNQLQ